MFLSTPKIAADQDNLTGNLTDRVLVKLSESHSLPECHGMMDVGSLELGEDTHTDTHDPTEHTDAQTRRPAIFSQYKRIWANPQPTPFH